MWDSLKKAAIENIAKTIVGAVAALVILAAISVWGAVNALRHVPTYSLQSAVHLRTILLDPSDGETRIIGVPTGVKMDEGICSLSLVGGKFGRPFERIGVYLNTNGEWVYDYRHGASKINGRIDCYSHPRMIQSN